MLVPFRKTVAIIDAMAFRRAWVESFLGLWANSENVELISLWPEDAHAKLIEQNCDMLIYDVGGSHPFDYEILAEIQVLRTLGVAAALVIFSDDTSQEGNISEMIRSGAQGYICNTMAPGLALRALSFILHGGTYFPPAVILVDQTADGTVVAAFPELNFPQDKSGGHITSSKAPTSSKLIETRPATIPLVSRTLPHRNVPEPQLSERQKAVLCCLCRGDPNKVIGRTLEMTEATVKVHVREIMRKLGACNRTQVAIVANRNITFADKASK